MQTITFKGIEFTIIDETPTHYVCMPEDNTEGYHYISKALIE